IHKKFSLSNIWAIMVLKFEWHNCRLRIVGWLYHDEYAAFIDLSFVARGNIQFICYQIWFYPFHMTGNIQFTALVWVAFIRFMFVYRTFEYPKSYGIYEASHIILH
ncbi:hypothetical protein ACJX0J_012636, partial [Zea mays]